MKREFHLFVPIYRAPQPARYAEFVECVRRNLANPEITCVHLVTEGDVSGIRKLARRRLTFHAVPTRPVFRDVLLLANILVPSGSLAGLANADVYFDRSISLLGDRSLAGFLLALTRWNSSEVFYNKSASQDAWILESPIKIPRSDIPFGIPGCDNRMAFEFKRAGYRVVNPSKTIKAIHLHQSGLRTYGRKRIPPPHLRVMPATLAECLK